MSAGCHDHGCDDKAFEGLSPAYKRVLLAVIALNIIGFAASGSAAVVSGSTALAANAGDFLGDSLTYAVSLAVIGRSAKVRASAALFAGWRLMSGAQPEGASISMFGFIGLVLNVAAAMLLFRYRQGDANVRSVWLCTRNDAIENVGVIATGGLVAWTGSIWPDLAMGAILGVILLQSAWEIIGQARGELRKAAAPEAGALT